MTPPDCERFLHSHDGSIAVFDEKSFLHSAVQGENVEIVSHLTDLCGGVTGAINRHSAERHSNLLTNTENLILWTSFGPRSTCAANYDTPDWVTEIKTKRAKEASDLDEQAKAAAWRRIGMGGKPAPGEPRVLADAKPNVPGSAPKWNPKNRGLEQPPRKHIDDPAKFVDGKTSKTRPVGKWARFATNSDGRSKTQLRRWCVCDQSKDPANKESATYPSHFVSTQGNPVKSNTHPNVGTDGSTYEKFKVDTAKAAASSSSKRKGPASAATSNTSATVAEADLKRATAHIEHLKDQLKQLGASRDATTSSTRRRPSSPTPNSASRPKGRTS